MDSQFEQAADAIINGDIAILTNLLREFPALVHAKSTRPHGATLLHYIAANGVEQERQKSPANATEIARLLLTAGSEVDALADMYGGQQTTLNMLVSSNPPAVAGTQVALAELLVDFGAAKDQALITALAHGYQAAAQALAHRGASTNNLPAAAGLGHVPDAVRLLPLASPLERQIALALAAQHGHCEILKLLLDAGEDPNRQNPPGFHGHATPLHEAALNGHTEGVRLLVARGARLDLKDTVYQGTPLGWAKHAGHTNLEKYLSAHHPSSVDP